ncbi:MAG: alpha/beta hydrolase [Patescibacteria group bacterium]|nr:alpha/beta hydrolase [Patescibacteria group bacterium]
MQERIRIPSTKGTLAAVIHRPEIKGEKPILPAGRLAILCPGYVDSKDYAHLVGLAEELCTCGYAVVRFEPTGTWESEDTIEDYTNTQYLADIKSVLEYMLQEEKYTNILLGGHNRGGQVAILYAASDSRITQVVAIMPSSAESLKLKDPAAWEREGFRISKRDTPDGKGTREFRVPYSHVKDRAGFDVVGAVKNAHAAMLIVTGDKDVVVSPESVKLIFDNANEPKKFIVLKDIGHDYRHNPEEVKIVNRRILEQLSVF